MSIDINNLGTTTAPSPGDSNRVGSSEANSADAQKASGKSSVSDTVSLSETAIRLGQLGVAVENQPVVDTKRVEQVKQAIMDGSYTVDPARIAEKMIDLDMALKPKD
ncbi:flagellar biosynthesis anti-sigma factor FlgM [Thiolapillus brandeum]|uniref:Negative regulator of flagellin synthesis n=1 Tax=Thiolapillus brandeum TaxID=1076588 RepID=A0A7U6GII1_9GAMM|nr:flagellar biosynthesis anti-sigma factor FlgM [Thiolapillus brandeum]BAO44283.1 negative regulator of flagellin synthesis FlgM [Thiolapillus brandeum]